MPSPLLFLLKSKTALAIAKWLLATVGVEKLLVWLVHQAGRVGDRQKAIATARQTHGTFTAVAFDDAIRWVVFADGAPIAAYPAYDGDLAAHPLMGAIDRARLSDPDTLVSTQAKARLRTTVARVRGLLPHRDREAADAESDVLRTHGATLSAELERLLREPETPVTSAERLPAAPGVYVLSDGPNPVYVGQTRDLRARIEEHATATDPASYAARLAGEDGDAAAALDRVRAMQVRTLELPDPVQRTLFEVLATSTLDVAHNDLQAR